jgi:hypothetical protein
MSVDSKMPTSLGTGLSLVRATLASTVPGVIVNVPFHSREAEPNVAVPFTAIDSPATQAFVVTLNLAVSDTFVLRT